MKFSAIVHRSVLGLLLSLVIAVNSAQAHTDRKFETSPTLVRERTAVVWVCTKAVEGIVKVLGGTTLSHPWG